ncbi:MAG: hypothetical protein U0228_24350 [Myxococcaceae bacterium]
MVLSATVADAQVARIVLRWKDVPGASAYELQIAKDSAFVEVVLQTRTTVAGYRWEQLPTTTHWWRVRSFDAESRPSEWSAPRTLAVDTAIPAPLKPADGAAIPCGATVALELDASPLVKEYLVELSIGADFTALRTLRSATPTFEVPGLSAGTWHWRTRAVDIKGRTTDAGPKRTFVIKVAPPKLKNTADVTLGVPQVTLAWGESGCAASYLVEATHDGRDKVSVPAPGTSLAFKSSVAGEYRWKVASVDERGTPGDFSAESVFKVRLATPVPRAEVVTGERAELTWAAVPTATQYRVELLKVNEKGATEPVASPLIAATSWKTGDLQPGEYRWRVSARDGLGHQSNASELRVFTRGGGAVLAAISWVEPAEDVVVLPGAEVELAWSKTGDAVSWELELDGVVQKLEATRAKTPPLSEGAHVARVRAVGAGFRFSDWTAPRELFAGRPAIASAKVALVGEAIEVRLFDGKQRLVIGGEPRFKVRDGSLSSPTALDGVWQLSWSPPSSGKDVLIVDDGEFHDEQPIEATLDPWVSVAARAGGIFNAGAIASPTANLGVTVRLPFLSRRPGLELRVSWLRASAKSDVGGYVLGADAELLPLTLLLAWHQNVGLFQLKGGVGPVLEPLWVTVGKDRSFGALPGVEAVLSLSRRIGPGRLEGEVSFLYARLETPLARLNAGGLAVRVGYALDL